jgi:capsular exopolysaccharide synthesis family protein
MKNQRVSKEEDFQIFELIAKYLCYWPWFALSVVVCCGIAYVYAKSLPNTYKRSASVMIKEDNGNITDIAAFTGANQFKTKGNVNNEIEAFKSPHIVQEVIQELQLHINYYVQDKLKIMDLYMQSPVIASFPDSQGFETFSFQMEMRPDNRIVLSNFIQKGDKYEQFIVTRLNDTVSTPVGKVVLTQSAHYASNQFRLPIEVSKSSIWDAAEDYTKRLSVSLSNKLNTVILLEFTDTSIERADAFLDALIAVYDANWLFEKNKVANNTSKFIDERLPLIEGELADIENDLQQYKSTHMLTDVRSAADIRLKESSEYSSKLMELRSQKSIAGYIKEYLNDQSKADDLLPHNTGLNNMAIESQIGEYNALWLKRKSLIDNSGENNPVIMGMNSALQSLKQSVIQAMNNLVTTLDMQLSNLQVQETKTAQSIASNPSQAKHILSLEREQKLKETLYLYLLQKREENDMLLAMTTTNTRVISPPAGSSTPVAPKKMLMLLIGLVVGVGIPGGIIWGKDILNTKIQGKENLEKLSAPLLGVIPLAHRKDRKKGGMLLQENGMDVINESFRIIRTNMDLMCSKEKNVILFTSLEPGAGKTSTALNLAMSFAFAGKKVILLDLDMRTATLSSFLSSPDQGISNYLNRQYFHIQKDYFYPGFDIIPVGTIPPNPSELLMGEHLEILIDKLKVIYDYVFIDCTPVNVVADATIVAKFADTCIFIVREGVTDRRGLPELESMYHSGKFTNMTLILNASRQKIPANRYYNTYYTKVNKTMSMLPKYGYDTLSKSPGYLTEGKGK